MFDCLRFVELNVTLAIRKTDDASFGIDVDDQSRTEFEIKFRFSVDVCVTIVG